MKFNKENQYFRWGVTAFLVIVSGIMFYYLMFHGANIKKFFGASVTVLMPVMFGFIISYLLTPVLNYIEYRLVTPLLKKCKVKEGPFREKLSRSVSIIITMILALTVISGLIAMLVSQIVPSVINITNNFDGYVTNFTNWINKMLENNPTARDTAIKMINRYSQEVEGWVNNILLPKGSDLVKTVSLSVLSMLKVLWNLILGLVISFYLLANKEKFAGQAKKVIYALFSRETGNIILNNFHFTHRTFSGFISGKVVDSILIGCLCFIGTSIIGTPYAALVSVIIGVTNVIPFFGPYLGAIPCSVLILLVDISKPLNCVYFVIFILLLQQFDGNVLGPKILGDSTGLTSFWVIFAITFFGGLMGIPGMIIGVPLFAVIYAAIKSFIHASLRNKDLPQETDIYINTCNVDEQHHLNQYVPEYKLSKEEKKTAKFGSYYISNKESTSKKV